MKSSSKILLGITLAVVLIIFGYGDYYLYKLLSAGAGIEAKILCSSVFVSQRTPESVLNEDLHHAVNYIRLKVNEIDKSVAATAFGLIERRAIFRDGLGSTLLSRSSDEYIRSIPWGDLRPKPTNQQNLPWPTGDVIMAGNIPEGIDNHKIDKILDDAFSEPYPDISRRTRAVVILYKGQIIAERYAAGFTRETPLFGYSMTQSVINALVGILVGQGQLSLDTPVSVPEWSDSVDPRGAITLNHLLRMTSGLKFDDSRPPLTDTVIMLGNADMAAYAAGKKPVAEPGTAWSYSNGTTNIIARLMRTAVGGTLIDYFAFPRRSLFDRLGMRSAVIEPDVAGTFVGSTYMYATARDWARFGLLYLNDGVWEGELILPEGWVDYSRTPTQSDPSGEYGAHFWTNSKRQENKNNTQWPHLPADAFFALGHYGQSLTIIPSHNLVAVRLGLTQKPEAWDHDMFIAAVLEAIP